MNETDPQNLEQLKRLDTDPQLDALLDQALAPDDPPAGLNDRIIAATAERLSAEAPTDPASAVIGRIDGGFPWRSLAAMLLFALVLGGVWAVNQNNDDANPTGETDPGMVVIQGDPPTAEPIDLETALDQLATAEREAELADVIDDRIDLLSMQFAWAETPGIWSQDAFDSLDTAIDREDFDNLVDEMELYF